MAGTKGHSHPKGQSSRCTRCTVVQVVYCVRAVGKGRMHFCHTVGLKICVPPEEGTFYKFTYRGPTCCYGTSPEHAHWQRRCAWAWGGVSFILRGLPVLSLYVNNPQSSSWRTVTSVPDTLGSEHYLWRYADFETETPINTFISSIHFSST